MSDKVQTKVYLSEEAKAMIDADQRTNSEAVEAAIWNQYGDQKKSALQVRLENKKSQLDAAKRTLENEQSNVDELQTEVHRLENQVQSIEDEREKQVAELLDMVEDMGATLRKDTPKVESLANEYFNGDVDTAYAELVAAAKNRDEITSGQLPDA